MKPKYLKRNDTISLVAPSFGCTIYPYDERMKVSIDKLSKDYRIVVGENCKKSEGIVASNTAKKRADEFMKAYLSDASVIWSVGGGETMVEILPHIDFKKIKEAEVSMYSFVLSNLVPHKVIKQSKQPPIKRPLNSLV